MEGVYLNFAPWMEGALLWMQSVNWDNPLCIDNTGWLSLFRSRNPCRYRNPCLLKPTDLGPPHSLNLTGGLSKTHRSSTQLPTASAGHRMPITGKKEKKSCFWNFPGNLFLHETDILRPADAVVDQVKPLQASENPPEVSGAQLQAPLGGQVLPDTGLEPAGSKIGRFRIHRYHEPTCSQFCYWGDTQ